MSIHGARNSRIGLAAVFLAFLVLTGCSRTAQRAALQPAVQSQACLHQPDTALMINVPAMANVGSLPAALPESPYAYSSGRKAPSCIRPHFSKSRFAAVGKPAFHLPEPAKAYARAEGDEEEIDLGCFSSCTLLYLITMVLAVIMLIGISTAAIVLGTLAALIVIALLLIILLGTIAYLFRRPLLDPGSKDAPPPVEHIPED